MSGEVKQSSDPRWGSKQREVKAQAIFITMQHFTHISFKESDWIDLGCGSGLIAIHIAPHVKSIYGIDPEAWERWKELAQQQTNLTFINESVEKLSCPDACADVVICNQVYEHVPNPQKLISEIERILKPGGYCYFAGPNLLFPIEPHVFWPFVHWLPRRVAVRLMRILGSKAILDAYSENYWTLQRWLENFKCYNAVPFILKNPTKYQKNTIFWRVISFIPEKFLHYLTWLSPSFVFVLQKPQN
ncbi:MAG: class I SAM-dependent methyltransferase [Thiotrichaceae bacterium]|nr:class I SAM-dependent methyltransferase [Thiotrichaceae bacterium]